MRGIGVEEMTWPQFEAQYLTDPDGYEDREESILGKRREIVDLAKWEPRPTVIVTDQLDYRLVTGEQRAKSDIIVLDNGGEDYLVVIRDNDPIWGTYFNGRGGAWRGEAFVKTDNRVVHYEASNFGLLDPKTGETRPKSQWYELKSKSIPWEMAEWAVKK